MENRTKDESKELVVALLVAPPERGDAEIAHIAMWAVREWVLVEMLSCTDTQNRESLAAHARSKRGEVRWVVSESWLSVASEQQVACLPMGYEVIPALTDRWERLRAVLENRLSQKRP